MPYHQILCGLGFVFAGLLHFIKPTFFLSIMPPLVPFHKELVWISGIAEITFGLSLLFPPTQAAAAWGLVLLLIGVFPANIYMATAEKFQKIHPFIRWGRLPVQVALLAWISLYIK